MLSRLAFERQGRPPESGRGVARNGIEGSEHTSHQVCPPWQHHWLRQRRNNVFVIGIDPHRGSHTATVLDGKEVVIDELRVVADPGQLERLLGFAALYTPRTWAVEGATGTGALLAQQLVAAGETVLDVPPTLSARVRVLDSGHSDKNDRHDARSAAIVALRHKGLRVVSREDHVTVLRLLAKRHHDLVAARTRAACRLHTTLCYLAEGHFPKRMTARQAAAILAGLRPSDLVGVERKAMAKDLLAEIRRLDQDLKTLAKRIRIEVDRSGTTVTEIFGAGPIVAAYVIGYTSGVERFGSAGHYARYNGTAPIEASSGPNPRRRLNPRGNRQLNHAMHMIAVTQLRYDTPGRGYYRRKQTEGHSRKEAMRALKRRISDSVYRQLRVDAGC
jgi:transposase